MCPIFVPTRSAADWKQLLAQPELHWKAGFSAMTLARAWEDRSHDGLPPEVAQILRGLLGADSPRLLVAIPEYQVALPGGARASQTDLVVLARAVEGLLAIAIEGKVDESLGPTVGEKRAEKSAGVHTRLAYLLEELQLAKCPDEIRYQLLHRTVSALQIARDFDAACAVMLIHSFSPTKKWYADFAAFAALSGVEASEGQLLALGERRGMPLYIGWCVGDQKYRATADVPTL